MLVKIIHMITSWFYFGLLPFLIVRVELARALEGLGEIDWISRSAYNRPADQTFEAEVIWILLRL